MARIVRFHKTGGPEVLQIDDVAPEHPGPGEIRLQVAAFGLNQAELLFRRALYLERPQLPSRIGYEAAGVVDAVGPDVSEPRVGDRVSTIPGFSMRRYGVYGESCIVPARAAVPFPARLSMAEGAAIWMAFMTAYGGLVEIGKVGPDDWVLITAASSSVGLAAIQMAKDLGATVVATTRGPAKQTALLEAGADHVIVTDEENLSHRVKSITEGRGMRVIFDAVTGSMMEKLSKAAASGGTIIAYGALSLEPTPYPLIDALNKGLTMRGFSLSEVTENPKRLANGRAYVHERLESGVFQPVIARTFPLEAVAEAHRYMETGRHVGKIVVTV